MIDGSAKVERHISKYPPFLKPRTLAVSMRPLPIIFFLCFVTSVWTTTFGQDKSLNETVHSTGYYSGLTLVFNPNMTFTLKFHGHISSDTAAGTYEFRGDTIALKYNYNNYETIFAAYKEQNEQVPIDIQLAASRALLRPKTLVKKRSRYLAIDETTTQPMTYNKNGRTYLVYLIRAR